MKENKKKAKETLKIIEGEEVFERIIRFNPAFDKRHAEDNKNYGIGSVTIIFILKGHHGAVQVMINTDWFLPATIKEYKKIGNKGKCPPTNLRDKEDYLDCWDVGFHAKVKPSYMEYSNENNCDILDSGKCYYDGSGTKGHDDKVIKILLEKGSDGIWKYLEKYYKGVFD